VGEVVEPLQLELALRLLKCPILEKRLYGLSEITDMAIRAGRMDYFKCDCTPGALSGGWVGWDWVGGVLFFSYRHHSLNPAMHIGRGGRVGCLCAGGMLQRVFGLLLHVRVLLRRAVYGEEFNRLSADVDSDANNVCTRWLEPPFVLQWITDNEVRLVTRGSNCMHARI
jgi:hypothetical protein